LDNPFVIPSPDLQIRFSEILRTTKGQMLQEALKDTVRRIDIRALDEEAHRLVSKKALQMLAGKGLRAELVFALPTVLRTNPYLLGYYRLLLGFSQKAFYTKKFGLSGRYQSMEINGRIDPIIDTYIEQLCLSLNKSAELLLANLAPDSITCEHLDDLTLLTFGPQLRGSNNVTIGMEAIQEVFDVIRDIIGHHANRVEPKLISLTDATGREIEIKFSSDPDIECVTIIRGKRAPLLAIEVKGGTDYSNAHNRLGEAEKSHLKAKAKGFTDLWTIVNVEGLSDSNKKSESPTTTAFFDLSDLVSRKGTGFEDFREQFLQRIRLPE